LKKKIKKSHVLIICPGLSIKKYHKKIEEYIKENDIVTFGCNHVANMFIPDYHFWGSAERFERFNQYIHKKSVPVFKTQIPSAMIKKYWKSRFKKHYKTVKVIGYSRGGEYEDVNSSNYGKIDIHIKYHRIYGYFRTIGSIAIMYAFMKKAAKIEIVGMDGYSFYSKKELDEGIERQHYYDIKTAISKYDETYKGTGYTLIGYRENFEGKKRNKENYYEHCKKTDKHINNTLNSIKEYGVDFEILTPTVYEDFYNPTVFEKREINHV